MEHAWKPIFAIAPAMGQADSRTVNAGKQQGAKPISRNDLDDAELSRQWKRINSPALLKDIKASPVPHAFSSLRVVAVLPESQAAKLGLAAGCNILKWPEQDPGKWQLH